MIQENHSAPNTSVDSFADLALREPLLKAVDALGFKAPSPIQAAFIPVALTGSDVTRQARTGTGKTAAFGIPILQKIDTRLPGPQALVLTPTRELAEQVANEINRLAKFIKVKYAVLVGGRPIRQQIDHLKAGAQIIIGTPGRVLDCMHRKVLNLDGLVIAVLDEADRMLDIGFRPDIERILSKCPSERQTLLLSATMPPEVEMLAKKYMVNPLRVDMSQDQVATDNVEQYYVTVDADRKFQTLVKLLAREKPQQALVFTRTKRGADKLHARFRDKLPNVALIHGDLPQKKRDSVMKKFREGKVRMLIATDVVGRGIDVSGISHIINYDIPEFCDDYVHRVGRTGRLSSDEKGYAFTFVTREQGDELTRIEIRINKMLPEYQVQGLETARPRKPVQHVEAEPEAEELEEFIVYE